MTKRLVYRLILLLLCVAGWQTSVARTESHSNHNTIAIATIDGTRDNTPQWQDIGMHDVLAITGSSTLTPPTTVRVVHDSLSGTVPTAQTVQSRHYGVQHLSVHSHHRMISGYIYLIRCLRL